MESNFVRYYKVVYVPLRDILYVGCERLSYTSDPVSQNASLKSPEHHLSPPPSDRYHLCIVCVRHDCSRHFPLWLAFTQCNQCCSCLKRPLVQYLSNADHPDASTTLLLVPFRRCDKRQTVWWACVKPLDLLLCLTALALFWMSPPSCMASLYW